MSKSQTFFFQSQTFFSLIPYLSHYRDSFLYFISHLYLLFSIPLEHIAQIFKFFYLLYHFSLPHLTDLFHSPPSLPKPHYFRFFCIQNQCLSYFSSISPSIDLAFHTYLSSPYLDQYHLFVHIWKYMKNIFLNIYHYTFHFELKHLLNRNYLKSIY